MVNKTDLDHRADLFIIILERGKPHLIAEETW